MKLYKAYKRVLTEGTVEACVSRFGQELFSPQMGGNEPNTEIEDDYAELIHNYTGGEFTDKVNPEFIEMARNLKKCVSAYPEILYPEGYAYKGTKTTIKALLESYDKIKNAIKTGQPFEMIYAAKTPIQSWSNDEEISKEDFGQSGPMLLKLLQKFDIAKENGNVSEFIEHVIEHKLDSKVPVVLRYNTNPNDFLFKGKFFNYLSRQEEDEVLRLDNRPIKVFAKIHPSGFSAQVFELLEAIRNN
jgi:hypothetical protein